MNTLTTPPASNWFNKVPEAALSFWAADDWHLLDKSIDRAFGALRADTPNPIECKKAMADVLATVDSLQAPR